jgi:ANTAR domain
MAEITESRACIDQTKGMLMLIYGIDDDAAFNLLKWLSQEAKRQAAVAGRADLVKTSAPPAQPSSRNRSSTTCCLTAHRRVDPI